MASSKVMSSTSPAKSDLPRHSTTTTSSSISHPTLPTPPPAPPAAVLPSLPQQPPHPPTQYLNHSDHGVSSFGSMNMEEILKNIYASEPDSLDGGALPGVSAADGGGVGRNGGGDGGKTVDDVWKEIVSGGGGGVEVGSNEPRMTLEDFLTKAGAVTEEDVRVPAPAPPPAVTAGGRGYGVEAMMNAAAAAPGVQFPAAQVPVVHMQNAPAGYGLESQLGFGNGMVAAAPAVGSGSIRGGGSGRGKRRAPPVEEVAPDKATQQKQRRMIKNRESAARSRERKQAYTVELESLVTQLAEENARLLREEAERNKDRFKQLMENLIPVVEQQRQPRVLRRVRSMSW